MSLVNTILDPLATAAGIAAVYFFGRHELLFDALLFASGFTSWLFLFALLEAWVAPPSSAHSGVYAASPPPDDGDYYDDYAATQIRPHLGESITLWSNWE